MDHYFTSKPQAEHERRVIGFDLDGEKFRLESDSHVFSKDHLDPGSRFLIETVLSDLSCRREAKGKDARTVGTDERGRDEAESKKAADEKREEKAARDGAGLKPAAKTGLDLGCGYGPVGIVLARRCGLSMAFSDVNERAVGLAKKNALRAGLKDARVICADGFSGMTEQFDYIFSNPPIRTGKEVIYRLFAEALEHLKPNGSLYIVIRRQQGAESALRYLNTLSDEVEVLAKSKGYWIIRANNTRNAENNQAVKE